MTKYKCIQNPYITNECDTKCTIDNSLENDGKNNVPNNICLYSSTTKVKWIPIIKCYLCNDDAVYKMRSFIIKEKYRIESNSFAYMHRENGDSVDKHFCGKCYPKRC